jgi:thymidylate synthase (FAD)
MGQFKCHISMKRNKNMKIVPQSAKLLAMTPRPVFLIEQCGRVCWKSEEKMACTRQGCNEGRIYFHTTGTLTDCPDCLERAIKFVNGILKRNHTSVLEHACATFLLVTDRGMTHEIVRHRIASYSQESTRFCNYGNQGGEITVVEPDIFKIKDSISSTEEHSRWKQAMQDAENHYLYLTQERKVQPQWARSVLPTCLKTEIAVTMNFRSIRHMLALRLNNQAGAAHPQIRALMQLVLDELMKSDAAPVFADIGKTKE